MAKRMYEPGSEVSYVYTAAEHEEVEKLRALYRDGCELLAQIGMHGKLDRDAACVDAFKSRMDDIDGGTYSKKAAGGS